MLTCTLCCAPSGQASHSFYCANLYRILSLFHSNMLFPHWVKLGGRNMIFSSFPYTSPSFYPQNSHLHLFFSLEPFYTLLHRLPFAICPPLFEPCKPFTAFYSQSHLFPSWFSPRWILPVSKLSEETGKALPLSLRHLGLQGSNNGGQMAKGNLWSRVGRRERLGLLRWLGQDTGLGAVY